MSLEKPAWQPSIDMHLILYLELPISVSAVCLAHRLQNQWGTSSLSQWTIRFNGQSLKQQPHSNNVPSVTAFRKFSSSSISACLSAFRLSSSFFLALLAVCNSRSANIVSAVVSKLFRADSIFSDVQA